MGQIFYTDARLAFEAGQAAMDKACWEEAVDALEQAVALNPGYIEAYSLLLTIVLQTKNRALGERVMALVGNALPNERNSGRKRKRILPPPGPADAVYQFMVTLNESEPPIWRQVQLTSNSTLAKLHRTILMTLGWFDTHLHEFEMADNTLYGVPDPEEDRSYGIKIYSDTHVKLYQLLNAENQQFHYRYDFGDGWEFTIVLEKILPVEANTRYPRCIDGRRAGPPEDVGGIEGYRIFLEALFQPWHPDHAMYTEWIGRSFDPEEIHLDWINNALRV